MQGYVRDEGMAFRLHSYAQKISSIEFSQAYCQVNRPTTVLLEL